MTVWPHLVSEEVGEEEGHHGFGGHAVVQVVVAQVHCLAGLHGQAIRVEASVLPLLWMLHPVRHEG